MPGIYAKDKFDLAGFSVGCGLIALSSLFESGTALVLAALLPMAFAQAAFLPTATEAVIEETPPEHRGLAMALFSQCFAISAIVAPLAGGALLDLQSNGLVLWLLMGGACIVVVPTLRSLKPRYRATATNIDVPRPGKKQQRLDAVAGSPAFSQRLAGCWGRQSSIQSAIADWMLTGCWGRQSSIQSATGWMLGRAVQHPVSDR